MSLFSTYDRYNRNSVNDFAISDRSAIEIEYFAIFYLLRRNISFMHLACLTLLMRSRYSKQLNLPLIKSDYLVVSGISFHRYPVPLCAFLFLSTVEILSSPLLSSPLLTLLSRSLAVSSRTILVQNDRHSEPRPFSARWFNKPCVRCTDAYTFLRDSNLHKWTARVTDLPRDLFLFL